MTIGTNPQSIGPRVPFAVPDIGEREIQAVVETMRSGWLTTGPNAAAFETEFSEFLSSGEVEAVAVNSATAGLHLALEALGIGPGDEVLVPTWTFTSTAEVVEYLGAKPVLVDVLAGSFSIDFEAAQEAITKRTRAIMPVHFAGQAVPARQLADFAAKNGLAVVEDAAHALPSSSEGVMVGAGQSDAVVFSFYATKTMTTGEGGMVVTRNRRYAQRMRTMRLHGISRDVFDRYNSAKPNWHYEVVSAGFKYNMPDTAAAIGRVQLSRVEEMRAKRQEIAERYFDSLGDVEAITLPSRQIGSDVHSWHLFVIDLDASGGVSRDQFVERMAQLGIGTSVHFIPLHLHPHWRNTYGFEEGRFPVATEKYKRVVSLPIFSSMQTAQVARVIDSVHRAIKCI